MKIRLVLILIFAAACTRLLLHALPVPIYNFSPIGAIGLFGAAYLDRRWMAFAAPFAALFLSDLFINNLIYSQFYDGFAWFTSIWTYASFAAVILAGRLLLTKKRTVNRVVVASLTASIVFFLVSNFSVWAESGMYVKNWAGLSACYLAAVPFISNTILSDLFFSAILFGAYEWMASRSASSVQV